MGFGDILKAAQSVKEKTAKQKAAGILIPIIDDYLTSLNLVDDGREPGFHCSQMYKLCPRMLALSKRIAKPVKLMIVPDGENQEFYKGSSDIEPRVRRIFDLGHAVHYIVQNKYLAGANLLWGHWRCTKCRVLTPTPDLRPTLHHCPNSEWEYDEPHVTIKEQGVRITGHSDGILRIRGVKYVIEIKSIKPESFTRLKDKPLPDHEYQAQLYMSALRIDRGLVLYMCKGTQELKEFEVLRSEAARKDAIKKAIQWLEIQRGKTEVPDRICSSPTDSRAWGCSWKDECFNDLMMGRLLIEPDAGVNPGGLPF